MHIYLHIAKTGGTTVRDIYAQALGVKNTLIVSNSMTPSEEFPNVVKEGAVRGMADFKKFKAVVGHIRIEDLTANEALPEGVVMHATIRDPIDRLISNYNFIRGNKKHPMHLSVSERQGSDYLLSRQGNQQAKRLGVGSCFADIQSALRRVNAVSTERSIDYFSALLLGPSRTAPAPISRLNVTADKYPGLNRFTRADLTEAQISELSERHHEDIILHREAGKSRDTRAIFN